MKENIILFIYFFLVKYCQEAKLIENSVESFLGKRKFFEMIYALYLIDFLRLVQLINIRSPLFKKRLVADFLIPHMLL